MEHSIGVGAIVGLAVATSIYVWQHEYFSKAEKTVLLLCVIIPPIQWLGILGIHIYYNYKAKNIKTKVVERNIKEKADSSINTLTELNRKGILTDEEYKEKIEKVENEKAKQDVVNSTEYRQLKNLLNLGVLTKEEFQTKIELLNSKALKPKTEEFRIIDGFSENLALVINVDLDYGFINEENEIVIPFIFDHAENFINGISNVRYKGVFRKINTKGEFI